MRLILFTLFIVTAHSLTSDSCCKLTRAQLKARRNLGGICPSRSSVAQTLLSKCQKCPNGTCRVNYQCLCVDTFLTSSFYHDDCEASFTVAWPASTKKTDLDYRGCTRKIPAKATVKSCCAMTTRELTAIRGASLFCPNRRAFARNSKCEKCSAGTCRVGDRCVCPENFLASSFYQRDCYDSFTVAWPASTKKTDLDYRGCTRKIPAKATVKSCCAMTTRELTAIRGASLFCPNRQAFVRNSKCEKCSAGTCRVGDRCVCPENFLASSFYQRDCYDSFTVAWPVSIRKTDLDYRGCTQRVPAKASRKSCCAMTKKELTAIRGASVSCPSSWTISLNNKCQKCAAGTCRVGDRCVCPEYFLSSSLYQTRCDDSFGVAWPRSIGKRDKGNSGCGKGRG